MKRQLKIDEIKASLSRSHDLYEIEAGLSNMKDMLTNYSCNIGLDIVPVKAIAYIEEAFRMFYSAIIDERRFADNIVNVTALSNIKLDVTTLVKYSGSYITLGEYLSYYFPCNKIEDINTNLSELLGVKYFNLLEEDLSKENIESKIEFPHLCQILNKTFNLRHQICHESALDISLDIDSSAEIIKAASLFISRSESIIRDIMYPDPPMTQYDMNESADQSFQEADKELTDILNILSDYYKDAEPPVSFEYIEPWKKYREKRAKIEANQYKGGSIAPLIYSSSMEQTTRELIDALKVSYHIPLLKTKSLNIG